MATSAVAHLPRSHMTIGEAAELIRTEVEAGLDAIASESPGLVSLGGSALRDKLELAARRVAPKATRSEVMER